MKNNNKKMVAGESKGKFLKETVGVF